MSRRGRELDGNKNVFLVQQDMLLVTGTANTSLLGRKMQPPPLKDPNPWKLQRYPAQHITLARYD